MNSGIRREDHRSPLEATILWRRLDSQGHDAAQLARLGSGWELQGVAVFSHAADPCRLDYVITCDHRWQTEHCSITGFVGQRSVAVEIARDSAGVWTIDGTPVASVAGCADIDLSFSPATNLLAVRRSGLVVGASAIVRAAWLRFPELRLEPLEQVYTRLAADRYLYESAAGTFRRELIVGASGFVRDYPGLWAAESFSEIATSSPGPARDE